MELKLVEDITPQAWDELISQFDGRLLFHKSAWLNFVEETKSAKSLKFLIIENEIVKGCFVGFIIRKGFLKIMGSPFVNWETDYMGPIVDKDFDMKKFLLSMDRMCRQFGIHHIQVAHPFLAPRLMAENGFYHSKWESFLIPLDSDIDKMWSNLKRNCRNKIRKGEKSGLIVEECNDNNFVNEYYDQLVEVFAKQNLRPNYPKELVYNLYKNLRPHGLLFSLKVKYGNKVIATGLFPHDEKYALSFGTASRTKYQKLCPNELLYWKAMCLAANNGVKNFNIGAIYKKTEGGGEFKRKFGGKPVPIYTFYKNYSALSKLAIQIRRLIKSLRN